MFKYTFVLIIILAIACGSASISNKNEILEKQDNSRLLWSSQRKLTWDDFQGKNQGLFDYSKAETTVVVLTENALYNSDKIPVFNISCYFLKEKSWTTTTEEFALFHEQLHFDIGELFARKIRKSFDSLNRKKIKQFDKYQDLFKSLNKERKMYNKLYDSEVYKINDSETIIFNEEEQKKWQKKIAQELEELNEFEFPS